MAICLEKGQKITLQKNDGVVLKKVFLGCGWDVVQKKSGFLSGFFKLGQDSIDLDASALLFDEQKNLLDVVYFNQLRSKDGSVQHSGDNLTGEGDGDDETIHVNLANLPSNVKTIIFTISSFRGQTFAEVENAFCRLVDQNTQQEIAKYNISAQKNYTSLIAAKIYREQNIWKMHALGEGCQGRTFKEMIPSILPLI